MSGGGGEGRGVGGIKQPRSPEREGMPAKINQFS